MFTGLIEGTGKVDSLVGGDETGGRLTVSDLPWDENLTLGESVAVNGVCLTAIEAGPVPLIAEISPETLKRSNLSDLSVGSRVNLERPLRIGDRLGGHMVQGHVDGLGKITRIEKSGDFWTLGATLPEELSRYVVEKGSISIDGISLTVASLAGSDFTVALIPKTWELTNLSTRSIGESVNIEVDVIAKYVERLMSLKAGEPTRITEAFLSEHGFL